MSCVGWCLLNLKLAHKVLLLVTIPIVFMIGFVAILADLQQKAEHAVRVERHWRDINSECNVLMNDFLRAGMILYTYKLTGEELMLQRFDKLVEAIPEKLRSIKLMLRDSPNKAVAIAEIEQASNEALRLMTKARTKMGYNFKGDDNKADQRVLVVTAGMVNHLGDFIKQMKETEHVDPRMEERARNMISQWLIGGVALSIVLAVILALTFNRNTTKRLLVIVENTLRLSKRKELLVRQSGEDEIAHLDHVFHDMAESLEEAAKRKAELLAIVSHDLRAPLTSVQGALTLLSEGVMGELTPRAAKTVALADNNTRALITLINDLLDIEKAESGNIVIVPRKVVLEELFERARDAVVMIADQNNIAIDVQDTDIVFTADPDRLAQVLINLVSNSIKFSPPNSTITLSGTVQGDNLRLSVKDQGRGVPAEFRDKIFERYQQVKSEDGMRGKGTGLGLSICKSFVEAHGGTIGVDSEEGKGSDFWMLIPLTPPPNS